LHGQLGQLQAAGTLTPEQQADYARLQSLLDANRNYQAQQHTPPVSDAAKSAITEALTQPRLRERLGIEPFEFGQLVADTAPPPAAPAPPAAAPITQRDLVPGAVVQFPNGLTARFERYNDLKQSVFTGTVLDPGSTSFVQGSTAPFEVANVLAGGTLLPAEGV